MIKIAARQRIVRECTAPFIYVDADGVEAIADIRVRYYSLTWNELEQKHAELRAIIDKDPDARVWPHQAWAERIESLPDLTDEHGKPFNISAENLGNLDTRNIEAIKKAIEGDTAGK